MLITSSEAVEKVFGNKLIMFLGVTLPFPAINRRLWFIFESRFFNIRENPNPTGYDHIIIGGSIRGAATSKELQDYIKTNKGLLKRKIRGLFAVCGNRGRPAGQQQATMYIDNHLAKLCEVSNVSSKVFPGRITKSLMDSQTARMMERMEDYDNLKRVDCMAFGQEILAGMK